MSKILFAALFLALLGGCAQPQQLERPMPNGAYLVIEGSEAWAVLVQDGQRMEERGRVLDVVKLPGQHSQIAASYVIETVNCGKLQWLTERSGALEGETRLLSAQYNVDLDRPGCVLGDGLSRAWTALDYSGSAVPAG